MPRSFDLIVVDLDGTLLDRHGGLSARNIAAVAEARDAGVEVIVATGRAWIESVHVLREIPASEWFIGASGALLTRRECGRTVARTTLPPDVAARITECVLRHGHLAHLLKDRTSTGYDYVIVGDGVLDPASEWWFRTLPVNVRRVESLEDDLHPNDTLRCGTVSPAADAVELVAEIQADLGDAIFMQHWGAVTQRDDDDTRQVHLLEIFTPETDKWAMVERHCARASIPLDRVAAIGDGLNDIRMVREAALGIAVGNAGAGVLHVADEIVATNDEHGVAEAIELVLQR